MIETAIMAQTVPVVTTRYEMWVVIAGIGANLILAWMSRTKTIAAADKAAVAADKATVAVDKVAAVEKKADVLDTKIDDVRLSIDGGLAKVLETIRAEGFAAGQKSEKMRSSVETAEPEVKP